MLFSFIFNYCFLFRIVVSPAFRLVGYFGILWINDMHNMQEEEKEKKYSRTSVENCIELQLKVCVKPLFQH